MRRRHGRSASAADGACATLNTTQLTPASNAMAHCLRRHNADVGTYRACISCGFRGRRSHKAWHTHENITEGDRRVRKWRRGTSGPWRRSVARHVRYSHVDALLLLSVLLHAMSVRAPDVPRIRPARPRTGHPASDGRSTSGGTVAGDRAGWTRGQTTGWPRCSECLPTARTW